MGTHRFFHDRSFGDPDDRSFGDTLHSPPKCGADCPTWEWGRVRTAYPKTKTKYQGCVERGQGAPAQENKGNYYLDRGVFEGAALRGRRIPEIYSPVAEIVDSGAKSDLCLVRPYAGLDGPFIQKNISQYVVANHILYGRRMPYQTFPCARFFQRDGPKAAASGRETVHRSPQPCPRGQKFR